MIRLMHYMFILNMLILIPSVSEMKAEESDKMNTMKLADESAMPAASINDVAWIAGKWQGEMFGGMAEETWSQPSGGSMMGMYKLIKEGKVVFYELLIIREQGNSLTYSLRHFGPDLEAWEDNDKIPQFKLVKITPDAVFFDGFTFRKVEDDKLQLFLRQDAKDKPSTELEFIYHRIP